MPLSEEKGTLGVHSFIQQIVAWDPSVNHTDRMVPAFTDDFKLYGAGSFPKKAALQQRPEEEMNSY